MTQAILINKHSNEYSQKLHFYPFSVKLDRCFRSCNTVNGEYLASIMDDSAIIYDEVINADAKPSPKDAKLSPKGNDDETKVIRANFNEKKATCKTQNFYI